MSFIIGYVDQMCQSFLSGCAFFLFLTIVFDMFVVDFDFSLPVGNKFFQSDDRGNIN